MKPLPRTTIITTALLAAALFGCGGERRPAAVARETTGTTMTTSADATRNELANAQRERTEAQALLAQERAARQNEQQKSTAETFARGQRDGLEMKAIAALEKATTESQAMREKGAKAKAKQRREIDANLDQVREHQAKLLADLRRLHEGVDDASWDAFRGEVETTITELDGLLSGPQDTK